MIYIWVKNEHTMSDSPSLSQRIGVAQSSHFLAFRMTSASTNAYLHSLFRRLSGAGMVFLFLLISTAKTSADYGWFSSFVKARN